MRSINKIYEAIDAEGCQGVGPFNWEIDEKQEKLIELWAKATGFWFVNSDRIL